MLENDQESTTKIKLEHPWECSQVQEPHVTEAGYDCIPSGACNLMPCAGSLSWRGEPGTDDRRVGRAGVGSAAWVREVTRVAQLALPPLVPLKGGHLWLRAPGSGH